jgi:hypothetical protein
MKPKPTLPKKGTQAAKLADQNERWDRIYREKFEDPLYYGVRLESRSPQADIEKYG